MPQSESQLEIDLLLQLQRLGFERADFVKDADSLQSNLKMQLEKFNQTNFSHGEFGRILSHLYKGDTFEKAQILRDRFLLRRDDESDFYVRFFNMDEWCKNCYQVTNQITQTGKYENRYDVTLLINGLPLIQIELKRRGVEMKEAFNQIQRYQKHSFGGTLFEYVQIFVISNGIDTKYFANNYKQNYEQTFYWTDEQNNKITKLSDFAEAFLEKCTVSQMIAEFIVLAETSKTPMILRPYQYYAVKAIENRVKDTNKNGYIWHTTGSGKTLTSFKTSQILSRSPEVKKVLFVVDRKDLDVQTTREFNSFAKDSVDDTDKTKTLVDQLADPNRKLIVTTIQKLDMAIKSWGYRQKFAYLQDEKLVIIFDECHRSQFGQTHAAIRNFFEKSQFFGFTGTPIFAKNHIGGATTADIFDTCLHKYIITDAIADNNVLGFAVEYVGKYKQKDSDIVHKDLAVDEAVPGIDTKEVLESQMRIDKVTNYVLQDWPGKTKNGKFNAMLATSSVEVLKKYYQAFQAQKPEGFKIATVFTYKANEEANPDMLDVDVFADSKDPIDQHSRDFLEDCIADYNEEFGSNYSTDKFYAYYKDVQKRTKNKEIDLLLVVNMMLTGFDSRQLNTLYVDKNLRYHGLIQAYSRTNRLYGPQKPHGNIVCFRNLKENTDKALGLFADEDAKETVFKKPYPEQKQEFNEQIAELKEKFPSPASVDHIQSEEEKAEFVKLFRKLSRIKASLETFAQFGFSDLDISEQEFNDYQSKYLDIYEDTIREELDKVSVLQEIDFELELLGKDNVNFDYIINLVIGLKEATTEKAKQTKTENILKVFERDINLRKKKDLIQKFIEENLPYIESSEDIEQIFTQFWDEQKSQALTQIAHEQSLDEAKLQEVINRYLNTEKMPRRTELIGLANKKPTLAQRDSFLGSLKDAIKEFVEKFEW